MAHVGITEWHTPEPIVFSLARTIEMIPQFVRGRKDAGERLPEAIMIISRLACLPKHGHRGLRLDSRDHHSTRERCTIC